MLSILKSVLGSASLITKDIQMKVCLITLQQTYCWEALQAYWREGLNLCDKLKKCLKKKGVKFITG